MEIVRSQSLNRHRRSQFLLGGKMEAFRQQGRQEIERAQNLHFGPRLHEGDQRDSPPQLLWKERKRVSAPTLKMMAINFQEFIHREG